MAEPRTTKECAADRRDVFAKEQTAVEQGLKSELVGQGQGDAPIGIDLTKAFVIVVAREVIGEIGILRRKAGTAHGEEPRILTVVVESGMVAEEMIIGWFLVVVRGSGEEHTMVVIAVEAQRHVHGHVAHVDVHHAHASLMMGKGGIEALLALVIEVKVVVSIGVAHAELRATWQAPTAVERPFVVAAEPDNGSHPERLPSRAPRARHLHGHFLLCVEAHAEASLQLVGRVSRPGFRRGEVQRSQRLDMRTETRSLLAVGHSQTMLQRDDLVPMAHGLLLAAPDERVDGVGRKRGRIVAPRVHTEGDIGQLEVVVVFVLTVHVDDLS